MDSIILVSGATGTVGAYVVSELAKKGLKVRAGVHTPVKTTHIKWPNVEFVQLDYGKEDTIKAAFKGVEKFYLLTPFIPEQVEIAKLLVDSAKAAGVKYIVKQSGMGAEVEPGITVGRLHRQAEIYIEKSGIAYTFLRPNFFMQNFINFYRGTIRNESKIYLPLGDGRVSYIDARDIGSVASEVLTREDYKGKALTLTGPEALSAKDAAMLFSKSIGRVISYVDVPEDAARKSMTEHGMSEWAVKCMMELHSICRAGFASNVTGTVFEVTGRRSITFEQFAKEHAEFLK
ncbi:MAG: SDR family oxidoreductase [Deltaproteobacteria bacterium]|nr:SDR family oxidoreductase [Deltaproteobacteria bacterium]